MADDAALIVVDVQNDFCPGGALPVPEAGAIVPNVNELARSFDVVAFTQDWHPADHTSFASNHGGAQPFDVIETDYGEQVLWPDHCVRGSEGAEFHPDLDATQADVIVRKGYNPAIDSYSAFFENDGETPTGMAGWIREHGADTVCVCGLATDFCVKWTAQDANRLFRDVVVVVDATDGLDGTGDAIAEMKQEGIRFETTEALTA